MALISCPECGKQISETTSACPHCGYKFSVSVADTHPTDTKLGEVEKKNGAGIVLVVIGVLMIIVGLPLIIIIPIGLIFIGFGVVLLCMGIAKLQGTRDAYCPHCGKPFHIQKNQTSFKCPVCRKKSYRDGDYLKPIL